MVPVVAGVSLAIIGILFQVVFPGVGFADYVTLGFVFGGLAGAGLSMRE